VRGRRPSRHLGRDLLFAARGFGRSPGLVLGALFSLGLGVGVNTSIFSLGMEFFFSQPSARDAQSLVSVQLGNSRAPETLIDTLRTSGLFADVAGENIESFANFSDGTETIQISNDYTTQNYFTMLGVPMLFGRGFIPADRKEVVVLGYHFWQSIFTAIRPSWVTQSTSTAARAPLLEYCPQATAR
jgi:hypothetical protein